MHSGVMQSEGSFLYTYLYLFLGLKGAERLEMGNHGGGFEILYVRNNETYETVMVKSCGQIDAGGIFERQLMELHF